MNDIHSVMTMKMSQKVLELSKEDSVMSVRMANVVDLIAAERKYHTKCFVEFERRVRRKKVRHLKCSDQAMNDLGDMLLESLSVGNVYDTGEVWETYAKLCDANDEQIPDSFLSRRQTYISALQNVICHEGSFVRPRDPKAQLLLYPSVQS